MYLSFSLFTEFANFTESHNRITWFIIYFINISLGLTFTVFTSCDFLHKVGILKILFAFLLEAKVRSLLSCALILEQ